jgi:hypothetical protein
MIQADKLRLRDETDSYWIGNLPVVCDVIVGIFWNDLYFVLL